MLYQLGQYNTKDDLHPQAKEIRDHILTNHDFESIYELIDEYDNLELESIIILNKAINAGYWDSGYGFNWQRNQEVQFWNKVHDKSNDQLASKLQLARTLQVSRNKNIEDLKEDYIEFLEIQPSLYYELITEDLKDIWELDKALKTACIKAMFIAIYDDMSIIEFDTEIEIQIKKHFKNEDLPLEIEATINLIRNRKKSII